MLNKDQPMSHSTLIPQTTKLNVRNRCNRICQTCLIDNSIERVHKRQTPPNLPHARPIEHFWSVCRQQYKKRLNRPKSQTNFNDVLKYISYSVAETHGHSFLKAVRSKVQKDGL